MGFTVNTNELNGNFLTTKGTFQHNQVNRFYLLPFIVNGDKINKLKKDFKTFKGIAGECYRLVNNQAKLAKEELESKKLTSNILATAQVTDNTVIESIIKKITFDDDEKLFIFDEQIFSYIDFCEKEKTLTNISLFLYTTFFNETLRTAMEVDKGQSNKSNIYYDLILDSLPDLDIDTKHRNSFGLYNNFCPKVVELFRQDLLFMLKDKNFFISYFPELLKYYYFTYLKQLTLDLNSFFDQSSPTIFFTVEWESLSKSRLSHQNGWKLFESKARNVFSHVNFFELISYIEKDDNKGEAFFKGSYKDIKKQVEQLSEDEQQELASTIEDLEGYYRDNIDLSFSGIIDWADFKTKHKKKTPYPSQTTPVYHQIYKFWDAIDYQFTHSARSKPYQGYQSWITEFCKFNFVRNRGRLGYSFSLDQDMLLFITKLCLGSKPKIRLKTLWLEFEKRGLYFDKSSQIEIIKLFEKINLLEKKSDSGDAQYVKKIQ